MDDLTEAEIFDLWNMIFNIALHMLPSQTAASVCDLSAPAFRKRLSRVRARIRAFVGANCGRVNPAVGCSCTRRLAVATARGRLDYLRLADEKRMKRIDETTAAMEELDVVAVFFRDNPYFDRSELFFSRMRDCYRLLLREG